MIRSESTISPTVARGKARSTPGLLRPDLILAAKWMGMVCLSCETSTRSSSAATFEHSVVWQPFETGIIRAFEVDCGLATTNTLNNCVIEIGVRKKANAHCLGFRSSSFAR